MFERDRTRPFLIRYALYLYFLGLSLRRSTSKALEPFIKRSYVAIWYWIQEFDPKYVYPNKKKSRISLHSSQMRLKYRLDLRKPGYGQIATEPIRHRILGIYISRHRNMLVVAESFLLKSLIKLYGRHILSIVMVVEHGILKHVFPQD